MVEHRLTRQDWLDAAIHALASQGHKALRAERLAKQLGVSRGSFYWHFADVETFEQAVLGAWEMVAVDLPYAKAARAEGNGSSTILRNLIQVVFQSPSSLERAVRSWATTSPLAAEAVARIDERRISLLTELVALPDAPAAVRRAEAVILYWTYLGHVTNGSNKVDNTLLTAIIRHFCSEQLVSDFKNSK